MSSPQRRYAALAALAVVLVALLPHAYFFYRRGAAWNGTFPLTHGDEVTYASYVAALIDNRPRRSDPYTGRDDAPGRPLPESYLSIQYLPPAVLSSAARLTGLSAPQSFFALTVLAAAASALALWWMLAPVMGDARAAAAAAVIILCAGSAHLWVARLAGGEDSYNYLAFLRRYAPSFALPLCYLFGGLLWRALRAESARRGLASAAAAGLAFAALVYSYFFLWTAALAFLLCLTPLWLAARPRERRAALARLGVLYALAAAALAPYFQLLSRRAPSTDEALMLARTRAPDLLRLPELVGLAALVALALAVRRGRLRPTDPAAPFAAALALTPFVVFNQQLLTGRSLQPFHYGMFGVNYLAPAALLLACALLARRRDEDDGRRRGDGPPAGRRRLLRPPLVALAVAAVAAGAFEALLSGRRHLPGNTLRDEARPALVRLAAEGRGGSTLDTNSLVFCTDPTVADALPLVAPQPVLWAGHMFNFPGVETAEDHERLALYLHFSGITFDDVEPARYESLDRFRKYFVGSLIGRARHNPNLRVGWTPITPGEVASALRDYAHFVATLDRARVERYPLSYVLTSPDERIDFTNLDRWYERDAGETAGRFRLYRVRLRPAT